MTGILYGVGVGPGDPELMTLKAARVIRDTDVIALPGRIPQETTAYRIAVQAVPELEKKELVPVCMPMVIDREKQHAYHRQGAAQLEAYLAAGRDVAFLTLGDPTIYSTFSYMQHIVEEDGYDVAVISGVPSFCAAAAALKIPLAERAEPLHVLPAVYPGQQLPDQPGSCVMMKSGGRMREIKAFLQRTGRKAYMVENCGMPEEKRYDQADRMPDDAGYFSIVITKGRT